MTTSRKESTMSVRKESVMNSALASSSLGSGVGGILGAQSALLGTADLQVQPTIFYLHGVDTCVGGRVREWYGALFDWGPLCQKFCRKTQKGPIK